MQPDLLELLSSGSLKLSVTLTRSEEVAALQDRVRALEAQLAAYEARTIRAENLFSYEARLNNQLIDLCRESGVSVPSHILKGLS